MDNSGLDESFQEASLPSSVTGRTKVLDDLTCLRSFYGSGNGMKAGLEKASQEANKKAGLEKASQEENNITELITPAPAIELGLSLSYENQSHGYSSKRRKLSFEPKTIRKEEEEKSWNAFTRPFKGLICGSTYLDPTQVRKSFLGL